MQNQCRNSESLACQLLNLRWNVKRRPTMSNQWGLCKDCKWWQIEPEAAVENLTLGLCIDEDLQPFVVRVSGNSGCNRFYGRRAGASQRLQRTATDCQAYALARQTMNQG
jgi:hypothetical protein